MINMLLLFLKTSVVSRPIESTYFENWPHIKSGSEALRSRDKKRPLIIPTLPKKTTNQGC